MIVPRQISKLKIQLFQETRRGKGRFTATYAMSLYETNISWRFTKMARPTSRK